MILLKRFIGKNRLKNPAAPLARKTGDAFAFSGLELDPIAKNFKNIFKMTHCHYGKEKTMSIDRQKQSAAESLRKTRTFGKVRCHNPSCMGRIQPDSGIEQVKCPTCGMEYRLFWVKPTLPRIRGPVWDVNRGIAQKSLLKKKRSKKGG